MFVSICLNSDQKGRLTAVMHEAVSDEIFQIGQKHTQQQHTCREAEVLLTLLLWQCESTIVSRPQGHLYASLTF